ncbi:MAG: hypothetical protein ACKOA4_04390 [Haliscomenobacter sp.]
MSVEINLNEGSFPEGLPSFEQELPVHHRAEQTIKRKPFRRHAADLPPCSGHTRISFAIISIKIDLLGGSVRRKKAYRFDLPMIAPCNKPNEQVMSFYAKMDSSVIFKKN